MKFNKNQKRVIFIVISIVALMAVFPPWVQTLKTESTYSERSLGYALLIAPPPPTKNAPAYGVKLDYHRLFLQWFIVVLIGGISVYGLKND